MLGPPGFKDFDRDGRWSDDTHARFSTSQTQTPSGAYAIDTTSSTGEPARPRYGTGFVSDDMRTRIKTLNDLLNAGLIESWPDAQGNPNVAQQTGDQPLFVDPWDHPILYYRANPAGRTMLGEQNGEIPGIYQHEDNGIITGHAGGSTYESPGIDFGAGPYNSPDNTGNYYHRIAQVRYANPRPNQADLHSDAYENTFDEYIHDHSIQARNEPVRKDTFLLISAGPDAVFGTADDVTNWKRVKD